VSKLLVAESADYDGFLPERLCPLLVAAQEQFKFTHIIAGASAISKCVATKIKSNQKLFKYLLKL
jgi:electron transfer flavoprotein alpha subunit